MANSKVQLANGTVLIDITDTTANAGAVLSGKYIYTKDGVRTAGALTIQHYYTGSAAPSAALGENGDIYLQGE